jgi:DNA invertase Pin-like site-specific DNA recombinase
MAISPAEPPLLLEAHKLGSHGREAAPEVAESLQITMGLLTGLAEVERELIWERTLESIEHRRATGGDLGGRRKSYSPEQADLVRRLRTEGQSVRQVAKATGLSLRSRRQDYKDF